MEITTQSPAEIDTAWADALEPINTRFRRVYELDEKVRRYRKAGPSYAELVEDFEQQAHELRQQLIAERNEIEAPFKAEWNRRGGWTRAYVVPAGHIHKSTACHTLHPTTIVGWIPEQSGWNEDEIVKAAGVHACTVCYPSAPVDELRAALAAEKAKTECPGSRSYDHDSSGLQYYSPRARCNHCGQTISATKTGKLRAHKPREEA